MNRKVISILSLVIISFCASVYCNAQAVYVVLIFGDKVATENLHLTIDAGLNHSQMPGLEGSKGTLGIYYGMGMYIKLNEKMALLPEIKPFSYRGADNVKPIKSYDITDANYNLSLNYLDLPILLQYKIKQNLYITTGPQLNFLLSAKQKAYGFNPNSNSEIEISENVYNTFKKSYFSWPIEVGFIIKHAIRNQDIELKGRYNLSFSNVISDASYASSNISMFQLILSIPFIKDKAN